MTYNKNTLTAANYLYGVENEKRILEYLNDKGLYIQSSSEEENKHKDIDCYINRHPVSIKTQHICQKTGNLAFELEVFHRFKQEWMDSWYRTGEATIYLFNVGNLLFSIKKSNIQNYELENKFDSIKRLTNKTKASQGNHVHSNAKVGLIALETLKDLGYVKSLGTL